MHQAEAAHHLGCEVPFFAAEGGAAGEGNPLRAVDDVARGVLRYEGGITRLFDPLRELAQHVVPGDLLPFVGTRRAIEGVFDTAGAGGELHRRRTLWAQPALVDGAVRVAFDLQELSTAVPVVGSKRHQRAADCTVGANGMRLRRPAMWK